MLNYKWLRGTVFLKLYERKVSYIGGLTDTISDYDIIFLLSASARSEHTWQSCKRVSIYKLVKQMLLYAIQFKYSKKTMRY